MITAAILVLYFILLAIFLVLAFFIAYHLVNFSLNAEFMIIMLSFFSIVSAGLLLSNVAIFFSINWNGIISRVISF